MLYIYIYVHTQYDTCTYVLYCMCIYLETGISLSMSSKTSELQSIKHTYTYNDIHVCTVCIHYNVYHTYSEKLLREKTFANW